MKRISVIMIASLLVMRTTAVAQSRPILGKTVTSIYLTRNEQVMNP